MSESEGFFVDVDAKSKLESDTELGYRAEVQYHGDVFIGRVIYNKDTSEVSVQIKIGDHIGIRSVDYMNIEQLKDFLEDPMDIFRILLDDYFNTAM